MFVWITRGLGAQEKPRVLLGTRFAAVPKRAHLSVGSLRVLRCPWLSQTVGDDRADPAAAADAAETQQCWKVSDDVPRGWVLSTAGRGEVPGWHVPPGCAALRVGCF